MSKILHISKYYFPFVGGIEQTARDIVLGLSDNDQKIICFNHEKGTKYEKIDDIDIIRVGCQVKIASQSLAISYYKELKKCINSFKPDIIIFHYPNPFVAHYLLKILKTKSKCKFVIWWHLDITKQKILGKLFQGQSYKLLKRADKIIATSPNYIDGSQFLSQYKEKCVVIPSCINENRLAINEEVLELIKKIKNDNNGKIICFSVGRHVEYKGFEYLIKAASLLNDRYQFFIAGSGPLTDELKSLAKNLNNVHFTGKINDLELIAYLNACDIFCFSSITKNEAFGLSLAEAMFFCKPAITFNIPGSGVNYVSINAETGIEVSNKDYRAYSNAIVTLANNQQLLKKYGENAHRRVVDNFMYGSFKENIRKMILELTYA